MEINIDYMVESVSEDVLRRNGYIFIRRMDESSDKFMALDNLGKIRTFLDKMEVIEFVKSLK